MPADFELRPETRTVYSRGWGALTDADLSLTWRAFRPCSRPARSRPIGRSSGISAPSTTSTACRPPASGSLPKAIPGRAYSVRACIVTTDEQFGLVRMYQALGEPKTDHVGITRSAADADAYIARERVRLSIAI